MFIQVKMVTVLLILFLGCSAVAKESKNCDRVQFSFDNQKSINTNQNFTEQSFDKNGGSVYYSFSSIDKNQDIQTIIWRNEENDTWLSQTRNYSGNNMINLIPTMQ